MIYNARYELPPVRRLQVYSVRPVLSGHLKRPKNGFQDQLSLNAGQKNCRSILQYFRPALRYHLSLRSLFCLFIKWPRKTGFTVIVANRKLAGTNKPVALCSVHTGIEPPFLLKIYYAITACMTRGFTS